MITKERLVYNYNLTKFINKQIKNKNKIIEFGLDSRGAWEGCTGSIKFADGTRVAIGDEVHIFDNNDNEIYNW